MKLPNPHDLRHAIGESLPQIDNSGTERHPAFTYVPPSHLRALDPDNSVVEGIRGSGKSFWWATLSSEPHRKFINIAFPQARLEEKTLIDQGFGAQIASDDAPDQDVLAQLVKEEYSPRAIWRAVVAYKADFGHPFPMKASWKQRVAWVSENPEDYGKLLMTADAKLGGAEKTRLILFDALDRLATDWTSIRPLAKGLLQVALDMRATRRIRLKIFVRPDMLEDREIINFPDASKLLARTSSLTWRRADLYALLFQCIGNADEGGDEFQRYTSSIHDLQWKQEGGAWLLPLRLATDEKVQELVFIALAGKAMSAAPSGHKRGKPYTWLVNRLQDGRDQVSPRSFCVALKKAAEKTPEDYNFTLHFRAIQEGVTTASSIRVNEIKEDYPWIQEVMDPLHGRITVPCLAKDIFDLWKEVSVLDKLSTTLKKSKSAVKLPPQRLGDGPRGVLIDLEELGLVQKLTDGRIQVPDVYRIAFGLGRRGGVKPLK